MYIQNGEVLSETVKSNTLIGNRQTIYLNALNSTYPTKTAALATYVGHINPVDLGIVLSPEDVWEQDITIPAETVNWLPNSQTFTSVSAGKATNTRYRIMSIGGVATEYRDININLQSREGVQFFGECGVNGVNLITLNGSSVLAAWSLVAGYYECSANTITNQNVVAAMENSASYVAERNSAAFAFNQVETLFKDDVPLVAKTSKVNVLNDTEFYFDGAKVYVLFNPASLKMEFTKYDTAFHCGLYASGATTSADSTSNVVISNLNITKYGGNIFSSPLGSRNLVYTAAKAYASGTPMFGWVIQYVNSFNNRGNGITYMTKGTVRFCKSYRNGATGVTSSIGSSTDTSLTTNVYGHIYGNDVFENNFAGYTNAGASGVAGGLKLTKCIGVKVYDNSIYRNGVSIHGNYPTDGLWFDVNMSFVEARRNRIHANIGIGLTYEISSNLICEDNLIYDNRGSWQMLISSSPNIQIRRNTVYGIFRGEQAQLPSTTFNHRLVGFLHDLSRTGSQPLLTRNVTFENNNIYFGLENTNEGIFASVIEYWFQGAFTPVSPTLQQIGDFMIAQNMLFRNNSYFTKALDISKLHFSYWNTTILRETLSTWQSRGIEIGSTLSTITF